MHRLAILLKTYKKDHKFVKNLISSFHKYNKDGIPMFMVVPDTEMKLFSRFSDPLVTVLSDKLFENELTSDTFDGLSSGYINQEIIKLSFWKQKLCDNYFCLDSEGEFIRDFHLTDFMYNETIPYTILVEDNELKVHPDYYKKHWVYREARIRRIMKAVGLKDQVMLTSHGLGIFSSTVLESLFNDFMIPQNLTYKGLLKISPFEFSWYNMWLQKTEMIPIKIREPLFKTFHLESHLREYIEKGITLDDISRAYIGIIINSSLQHEMGLIRPIVYQTYVSKRLELEDYSSGVLFNVLFRKVKAKLCRKLFSLFSIVICVYIVLTGT